MTRRNAWFATLTTVALCSIVRAQDAAPSGGFEVSEIVLSKSLDNGNPVDPTTSFAASDGRVYATIRVNNPERTETSIRVVFQKADAPSRASGGVELEIPARPRYRTVARTGTARAPGRYRCVVFSSDGTELKSIEFDITG